MKTNKLKELREQKNLTQEFIAKKIGLTVAAYSMYENNKRQVPYKKAKMIAEILGVRNEDIFLPKRFAIRK